MSCAACSARVEKAVKSVQGVQSCAVNLLTNSMDVEGVADDSAIISAVTSAGYGASLLDDKTKQPKENNNKISNTVSYLKRFLVSLICLIFLFSDFFLSFFLPYTLSLIIKLKSLP